MATTSPDNIWTPDSGDDYALTVDLAATADTVQDAITSRFSGEPLIQRGTISFVGNGSGTVESSVNFPTPFSGSPTVITGDWTLLAGNTLVTSTVSESASGFTARMAQTGNNPGFGSTYTVNWIAIGVRP